MTHAAHTSFAQMDVPFNSVSQTLTGLQPPPPTVLRGNRENGDSPATG